MLTATEVAGTRFFEALSADEQAVVARYLSTQTYPQGAVIFYEGDPGNALCIVLKGTVTIGKEAADGTLQSVATIKEQDIFGEGALIDNVQRSATAMATTACKVLNLNKTAFETLSQEHPQLAIRIISKVARVIRNRLRSASADLADLLPH